MKWQPIDTAPTDSKKMFVVIAASVKPHDHSKFLYTTDPYCVYRDYDGEFVRWPHDFPPTHWCKLPDLPKGANNELSKNTSSQ